MTAMTSSTVPLSAAVRRVLATLAVLACLAFITAAALMATRYVAWNWASALLAAGAALAAVWVIGRALDSLETWVEQGHVNRKH